jgi:hypothetical protein
MIPWLDPVRQQIAIHPEFDDDERAARTTLTSYVWVFELLLRSRYSSAARA